LSGARHLAIRWSLLVQQETDLLAAIDVAAQVLGDDLASELANPQALATLRQALHQIHSDGYPVTSERAALARLVADAAAFMAVALPTFTALADARATLTPVVPEAQPGPPEAPARFNALAATDFGNHGKVVRLQFQISKLLGARVFDRFLRDVNPVQNLIDSYDLLDDTTIADLVAVTGRTVRLPR
jgi:hypothetical protein